MFLDEMINLWRGIGGKMYEREIGRLWRENGKDTRWERSFKKFK
jgi:hypothetical protein